MKNKNLWWFCFLRFCEESSNLYCSWHFSPLNFILYDLKWQRYRTSKLGFQVELCKALRNCSRSSMEVWKPGSSLAAGFRLWKKGLLWCFVPCTALWMTNNCCPSLSLSLISIAEHHGRLPARCCMQITSELQEWTGWPGWDRGTAEGRRMQSLGTCWGQPGWMPPTSSDCPGPI